jgi:hypothetical protein
MAATDSDDVANRRAQLRRWIREHCENKQSVFVDRSGINQGELSGLLKNKSFGEKRARSLEAAAGMPAKYLDQRLDVYAPAAETSHVVREPAAHAWPFTRVTPAQFDRLSDSEKLAIEQLVALLVSRATVPARPAREAAHSH